MWHQSHGDKRDASVFQRLSNKSSFRVKKKEVYGGPKQPILFSQRLQTDLFLTTICICCFFVFTNRTQLCSHKCFTVIAEDRPRDNSVLLTTITEWAAQTQASEGVISQKHNRVGNVLVVSDAKILESTPKWAPFFIVGNSSLMQLRLKVISLEIHQAIDLRRTQQGKHTRTLQYAYMNDMFVSFLCVPSLLYFCLWLLSGCSFQCNLHSVQH